MKLYYIGVSTISPGSSLAEALVLMPEIDFEERGEASTRAMRGERS
jgi:hypothetical protein